MDDSLLRRTSNCFEAINFTELNERWVDAVADSEFTDVEENNMTTSILFAADPVSSLSNLCSVCEAWCNIPVAEDSVLSNESSFVINASTRPDKMLWSFLNQMDISIRQVQAFIYFLCHKAVKTSSPVTDKMYGLISAKLYFSCLKVPGSSAYNVYYASLFSLCVDCVQMPDLIEGKDAVYKWKHFDNLVPHIVSTLTTLVPLLKVFHLGNDSSASDNVIKKLTEFVGCETCNSGIKFDTDLTNVSVGDRHRSRYSPYTIISTLAFQGLSHLLHSEVNSDPEHTYAYTLSCLNYHILCNRVRKSQTIPSKFSVIKDNCVSYICYNLKKSSELCAPLTVTTMKRLCLTVVDKSDFRTVVAVSIYRIACDLPAQSLAEFIKWLLLLADSSESNNRVIALEIMGHLVANVPSNETENLDEHLKVYLTPVPLIFSILTRCDDVSPNVRTKALTVLSHNIDSMLNVLKHVGDPSKFPIEELDEDIECDMNGDHRSFWYSFQSFKPMLDEITALFHRRIDDNNGIARKAALQALESIILFDLEYLSEDNLKLFVLAANDPNILIRKQTIQSLTAVLEKYHTNVLAQDYWIKCILPLVQDPENSVQAKVLSVIEEKFLIQFFSQKIEERSCAFNLLGKLACGEFLSHQRYLQKAFSLWKDERKLRPQMIKRLKPFFDGDREELLWLYISIFSAFCQLPTEICELAVEEYEKPANWLSFSFMENILKILGTMFSSLPVEKLNNIKDILLRKIEEFAAPVEILPLMIEVLGKVEKHLNHEQDLAQFASKMIKLTVDTLTPFVTKSSSKALPSDDDAIKSLTIIKEFCHIYPEHITQHLLKVLKCFVYSSIIGDSASERQSLISKRITTQLRAHAFASLGKISLQDEELAKDLLPILAKEVLSSKENVIRNNVVIILIEMCKRYTSYADKYVRLISLCFKDPVYLVRYQAITLVVSLLQEDYIKWKGCLLFCLLSTLIDAKESIQELGKYCLCQLLYEKRKSIFADCFVDAVFVFNHFIPPDNERLAEVVNELPRFALQGDSKLELRTHIYKFMLNYMDPAARAYLVKSLCQEILSSVADGVYPLNKVTESMVKDCFAVISSKEIRAYDTDSIANEVEENEEESVTKAEIVARKVMIVQPVIPVIISLKNCVMEGKSELLSDIVMFLKEILSDYQNEIEVLLRDDKMLLMQVKFEIRNETVHQERRAKEKREAAKSLQHVAPRQTRATVAEEIKETTAYILQRGIGNDSNISTTNADRPSEGSVRLLPKTPLPKSLQKQSAQDKNGKGSSASEALNQLIPQFQSTPRVVLKPLKLSGLTVPNISRIHFDEEPEEDS